MRALPEFNNLCAFVLDACVFNLIEEVSFGTPWDGFYQSTHHIHVHLLSMLTRNVAFLRNRMFKCVG